MTLVEAILAQNASIAFANTIVGALIRRIDPPDAAEVAAAIRQHVGTLAHPVFESLADGTNYFLAVMAQESGFDRKATNLNARAVWNVLRLRDAGVVNGMLAQAIGNADAGQPVALLRADLGIGQKNIRAAGITANFAQAVALIFTLDWSVATMATDYARLLAWAVQTYPTEDPRWVATGAYNRGRTGFQKAYANKGSLAWAQTSRHMDSVKARFEWFKTNLTEV